MLTTFLVSPFGRRRSFHSFSLIQLEVEGVWTNDEAAYYHSRRYLPGTLDGSSFATPGGGGGYADESIAASQSCKQKTELELPTS